MASIIPKKLSKVLRDLDISETMSAEILQTFSALDQSRRKTIIRHLQSHNIEDISDDRILKTFSPFFTLKKGSTMSAAGIGNGESLALLLLDGAKKSKKYGDIIYKNKVIEVKELAKDGTFRLSGNIASTNGGKLQKEMQAFYDMLEMMRLPTFNQINACISKHFLLDGFSEKIQSFREINTNMMNHWRNGFQELHDLTKNFTSAYCIMMIESTKFIVKRSDFEKLEAADDSFSPMSIEVLGKTAARKDVDILLSVIADHPYVKNPMKFEDDVKHIIEKLESIVDGFLLFWKVNSELKCQYISKAKFSKSFIVERITEQKFKLKFNFN